MSLIETPLNPGHKTAGHSESRLAQIGAKIRNRTTGREYTVDDHPGGAGWLTLTRCDDGTVIMAAAADLAIGNYALVEGSPLAHLTPGPTTDALSERNQKLNDRNNHLTIELEKAEWQAMKVVGDLRHQKIKELEARIKELTLYCASLEEGNAALLGKACGLEIKLNPLLPENVIAMRTPVPFPQILAGLAQQYRIASFIVPEAWLAHQHAADQCYGSDAICTAHLE